MSFSSTLLCLVCTTAILSGCATGKNFSEGIQKFQTQNYRDAFVLLKPEAVRGNPEAQYAVGYMYYYGQGVTENKRDAIYWIGRAAKAGMPYAVQAMQIINPIPVVVTRGLHDTNHPGPYSN